MKLLVFERNGQQRLGIVTGQGVVDVFAAAGGLGGSHAQPDLPGDVEGFYRAGLDFLPGLRRLARIAEEDPTAGWILPEAGLELSPVVPRPGKIICIGLNYRRHAEESGAQPPSTPVLFSKFSDTVAAHGEDIPLYPGAVQYDYEAELVAVIGRHAFQVSPQEALSFVLGYCNGNDLSARDLQMRTGQWLLGKTLPKFMPIGPILVTVDEVPDPQDLPIRCWLNGELRQDSTTGDMIFPVAELVSYITQYFPLDPGDLITTGTPEGVILGRAEKDWMKPGDETIVEVGPLGQLRNRMVQPGD